MIVNSIGDRFGRLVLVRRDGQRWHMRCDCGTDAMVLASNVRRGATTSCGCARRDLSSARAKTHGLSKHWLYKRWAEMIFRCTNPKCDKFEFYGGRGIKVCDRWLGGFEPFLEDMGAPPTRAHSIDRINNDGDYEPSNCRWATKVEQMKNRRPMRRAVVEERAS